MFADRTNWNLAGNRLSEALARHRASGKRLHDLTASNPTECGLEYDSEVILAALRNPAALRYEPNSKGLASARLAVTEYYSARGIAVSADDIVLTTSTSEAYSFVFRLLCNPGDELLIPAPSYPLFAFLADIQDVKLVRYPLLYDHGWQIDLHSLQQAITARTKGVIVVNPNNPTGHFVKEKELAKLNELCAAHELALQKVCTRLELEGGWYAVLRMPAVQTDEDLAIELLDTKDVYVHPGHFFDFAGDGFLVLSLITREEEFAEGVKRLLSTFS